MTPKSHDLISWFDLMIWSHDLISRFDLMIWSQHKSGGEPWWLHSCRPKLMVVCLKIHSDSRKEMCWIIWRLYLFFSEMTHHFHLHFFAKANHVATSTVKFRDREAQSCSVSSYTRELKYLWAPWPPELLTWPTLQHCWKCLKADH
jgi:hypothetical protein